MERRRWKEKAPPASFRRGNNASITYALRLAIRIHDALLDIAEIEPLLLPLFPSSPRSPTFVRSSPLAHSDRTISQRPILGASFRGIESRRDKRDPDGEKRRK